jgi:hypothetical protein
MSTLVSLLLAAVLNFLGHEMPQEVKDVSGNEIELCDDNSQLLASNQNIIKNEQLFKVKGIR